MEELHLHALNYRGADTQDAQAAWEALEAYVAGIVAEMVDAGNEACANAMAFEREECAKVCDGIVAQYGEDVLVAWFAEDIRARGQS